MATDDSPLSDLNPLVIAQVTQSLWYLARKWGAPRDEWADLVQAGWVSALSGMAWFDPSKSSIVTWLVNRGRSGMQHYLRDRGRLIRRPAWIQEIMSKIHRSQERLADQLRRQPTPEEIAVDVQATVLGKQITGEMVERLSQIWYICTNVTSLDLPLDSGESGTPATLQDVVTSETGERFEDRILRRVAVMDGLQRLPPLDRELVWGYYVDEQSYRELAIGYRLPASTVAARIRRSVERVRRWCMGDDDQTKYAVAGASP